MINGFLFGTGLWFSLAVLTTIGYVSYMLIARNQERKMMTIEMFQDYKSRALMDQDFEEVANAKKIIEEIEKGNLPPEMDDYRIATNYKFTPDGDSLIKPEYRIVRK